MCVSDVQNKIFNFGLILKKNLMALDFTHFLNNNGSWKGKLEQEDGRALASFQLVPSIIMTYCRESISKKNILELKKLKNLMESPFSNIQLNAQNLASRNFIKLVVMGCVPNLNYKEIMNPLLFLNFDIDQFQYRADTATFMQNSTRFYMAIKHLLDKVDNQKKVLNRAADDIQIVKVSEIMGIKERTYHRKIDLKNQFSPSRNSDIYKVLDYGTDTKFPFECIEDLKVISELLFEYVCYPKFLMRNCTQFQIDIEKYRALSLYTTEQLGGDEEKSKGVPTVFKKAVNHAFIVGLMIDFQDAGMESIYQKLDQFLDFFEREDKADEYSKDLVQLIYLVFMDLRSQELVNKQDQNTSMPKFSQDKMVANLIASKLTQLVFRLETITEHFLKPFTAGLSFVSSTSEHRTARLPISKEMFLNEEGMLVNKNGDDLKIKHMMAFLRHHVLSAFDVQYTEADSRINHNFSSFFKIKKLKTAKSSSSFITQKRSLLTANIYKMMSIQYCRLFTNESGSDSEHLNMIVSHNSMIGDLSSIIKKEMVQNNKMQEIMVQELVNTQNTDSCITQFFSDTAEVYHLHSRKNKVKRTPSKHANLRLSVYGDSYVKFWEQRESIIEYLSVIAENNLESGKQLYFDIEEKISLVQSCIVNLKEGLDKRERTKVRDYVLQSWLLDFLQEICIGSFKSNQQLMVKVDNLEVFNFANIYVDVPRRHSDPKLFRDLSLLKFYLSVLEGEDPNIVQKVRIKIKP